MAKLTHRNRPSVLSPYFLALFQECFARYRVSSERQRLLDGIDADPHHSRLTVISAAIFVCFVAARRKWPKNEWRVRNYKDARWRSQYGSESAVRFFDTATVRRQSTINEIKRVEALLALRLSVQAGYPTHSRTLWRCFERALRTDGLGTPSRKAAEGDIDDFFASIRLSLYNQRKRHQVSDLIGEAQAIYRELRLKLNDKTVSDPRDRVLISANHRKP